VFDQLGVGGDGFRVGSGERTAAGNELRENVTALGQGAADGFVGAFQNLADGARSLVSADAWADRLAQAADPVGTMIDSVHAVGDAAGRAADFVDNWGSMSEAERSYYIGYGIGNTAGNAVIGAATAGGGAGAAAIGGKVLGGLGSALGTVGRGPFAAGRGLPVFEIDRRLLPQLADNIRHAQRAGHPDVLTRAAIGANAGNRRNALTGVPHVPGLTRDEYPFASTVEGGAGAWVGHILGVENSRGGTLLGDFYRTHGIRPGDCFTVRVR
jgi:hypothetical protein